MNDLTWEDYEEIADVLVAMNNMFFSLHLADSHKIDKWREIRERVSVAGHKLREKEQRKK